MKLALKILIFFWVVLAFLAPTKADTLAVQHPFMLWTPNEAAIIRNGIETVPWKRKAYQELLRNSNGNDRMRMLFQYAVMGDESVKDALKNHLMDVLNSAIPLGGALEQQVLIYDALYNSLIESERALVETKFREYIAYSIPPGSAKNTVLFNDAANYSRYDANTYAKTNWLPNIIFPRKISANLMALALRDERLIRETWAVHGSLKFYFDEYLSDKGFYAEEFEKMWATPGALFYYCIAAKNLGLNELGFGYTGKGGATFRQHIETVLDITYPMVDLGTDRPSWPKIAAGDTRGYPPFQHSTVTGYFADETGGNEPWIIRGAWGGPKRGKNPQWDGDSGFGHTPKMNTALWFELAHKLWPDGKFDYFLAQMRKPNENYYYPSLYFGLDSINPAAVKPPNAPSAIYPERGVAILRHDESPAYWRSDAPAVGLRLASPYAHSVRDAFAIAGYFALNKPIYQNPHANNAYAAGFSASILSHCAVSVDANNPYGITEPNFTTAVDTRHGFDKDVKFIAASTSARYEGITELKSLFLTKEYMFEVSDEKSKAYHSYLWTIYANGDVNDHNPTQWSSSTDMAPFIKDLTKEQSTSGETNWSVTVNQMSHNDIPPKLGTAWFNDNVGVKITMIGQPNMKAYFGDAPKREGSAQLMNLSTVLSKIEGKNAQFIALHEPFRNMPVLNNFELIGKNDNGLAVSVKGGNGSIVNDRLMLGTQAPDKLVTITGNGESFVFANYGYVRLGTDTVRISGSVAAMSVKVNGIPVLMVNGKQAIADIANGILVYNNPEVGIDIKNSSDKAVQVYPNPTQGSFSINLSTPQPEEVIISVYNANGQTILTEKSKSNTEAIAKTFDLTAQPKGVYLVKIITSKGVHVKRLLHY